MEVDQALIVNRIPVDLSPTEKAEMLGVLSVANEPIIKPLLKQMDDFLRTNSITNIKTKEKIIEKATRPEIKEEKPWFAVEHVRDSFRFCSVVERFSQIVEAIIYVTSGDFKVVKLDLVKMVNPTTWGWRVAVLDLEFANGQLVEWYLPFREMYETNETINHEIFEKWRNLTEDEIVERIEEYNADLKQSRTNFSSAFSEALKRQGLDLKGFTSAWAASSLLIEEFCPLMHNS